MDYTILAFVFLFGTIVGSFLNVVILRYDTPLTLGGRSKCFSCNKTLNWYELIPVLSFLLQRGKCRKCGSRISNQYFFVEIFTGLSFLFVFMQNFTVAETAFLFFITSVLVIIFVYDLKHKIIPDSFSFLFASLAFFYLFIDFEKLSFLFPNFWDLLAGPILFLFFFLLWYFSQGRWIGLGDAKLAVGMGWLLGLYGGVSAVAFAFWIGAVVVIFILFVQLVRVKLRRISWHERLAIFFKLQKRPKTFTMKSEVPFAPFLVIGTIIVYFSGIRIFDIGDWIIAFFL